MLQLLIFSASYMCIRLSIPFADYESPGGIGNQPLVASGLLSNLYARMGTRIMGKE
jgi:hypothetical protein